MSKSQNAIVMIVVMVVCWGSGCTPRTLVKKNPGPDDLGVRYYRPKPYLMVKPAVDKQGIPIEGYVSIETMTLPDFSEEYSIHVRPGLGTNQTSITLEDGWNLTKLNVDVDSQIDEALGAVADIIKAVPTGGIENATRVSVKGINVPIGLYESVISNAGCSKRLNGFRYIGFMPFSNASQALSDCEASASEDSSIYGLVFDHTENVLVFKPLAEIPYLQPTRTVTEQQPPPVLEDPNRDTQNNPVNSARRS